MSFDKYGHLPENIANQMRAMDEQNKMLTEVLNHQIRDLLDNLDDEGLDALDTVIVYSSNPATAGHFRGQIAQLRRKFGVCPCGEEHEGEVSLVKAVAKTFDTPNDPPSRVHGPGKLDGSSDLDLPGSDNSENPVGSYHERFTEGYQESCHIYGVERNPTESRPNQVVCYNCGMDYPSLSDRMRRPPGLAGCSGCQQKSAHG